MNLTDAQIMHMTELVAERVANLESKQQEIDDQIKDEVHALRNLLNVMRLELEKRRLKG